MVDGPRSADMKVSNRDSVTATMQSYNWPMMLTVDTSGDFPQVWCRADKSVHATGH